MPFQRDFNDLLDAILTDYRNAFGTAPDRLLFLKSVCLASALWGIYKNHQDIAKQIFPDTGDAESLAHHAWIHGLTKLVGETDAGLLSRLLSRLRRPAAGGNRYDYEAWAKEVEIAAATLNNPTSAMLSSFGVDSFDATHCIDEETGTVAWLTDTSTPGAYVAVDAGASKARHYVAVRLYLSAAAGAAVYSVQYSDDGASWTSAATGFAPSAAGWNETIWSSVGVHRYWRLYVTNTPGAGPGVTEMEWHTGIESVADAVCYPCALGPGTVDVVLVGSVSPGVASDALVGAALLHIEDLRPVTANETRVLSAAVVTQNVEMIVYGTAVDAEAVAAEVESYLAALKVGQIAYKSQLVGIAISAGATNAEVTVPAADVDPGAYAMVRPGVVEVDKG